MIYVPQQVPHARRRASPRIEERLNLTAADQFTSVPLLRGPAGASPDGVPRVHEGARGVPGEGEGGRRLRHDPRGRAPEVTRGCARRLSTSGFSNALNTIQHYTCTQHAPNTANHYQDALIALKGDGKSGVYLIYPQSYVQAYSRFLYCTWTSDYAVPGAERSVLHTAYKSVCGSSSCT